MMVSQIKDPKEERWEQNKIWEDERFREQSFSELTKDDIYYIRCDEKYEEDR